MNNNIATSTVDLFDSDSPVKEECLENLSNDADMFNSDPIGMNLNQKLSIWANANYITHKAFTELVELLKESSLDLDVPNDCRTLLKTKYALKRKFHEENVSKSKYINLQNSPENSFECEMERICDDSSEDETEKLNDGNCTRPTPKIILKMPLNKTNEIESSYLPNEKMAISNFEIDQAVGVMDPTLTNLHTLLLAMHSDMQKLTEKMNQQHTETISRIEKLDRNVSGCNVMLESINKTTYPTESNETQCNDFKLPLQTADDVENLNENLQNANTFNDFKKYVKFTMGSINPKNISEFFTKIASDSALLSFNWNGTKGKKSFASMKRLCNGIYDAVKNDEFGIDEFEDNIKKIIKFAHRRIHSANFRKREKIKVDSSY